jgi:hypothetical protein
MGRDRIDDFWFWLSYRLPRRLVYFCMIRAFAWASCGKWSGCECPAITVQDALERWNQSNE